MGHEEHKSKAPASVGVGIVTVSTSRTTATDEGGPLMLELIERAGHRVLERRIVRDDAEQIRACLKDLGSQERIQAVFLSGGSGIAGQDLTVEAISPLVSVFVPGFGELFRCLSFSEIGPAAMLSRATAAVCRVGATGRRFFVAVLPGSPAAVRLALERLLLPELGHLVFEIER